MSTVDVDAATLAFDDLLEGVAMWLRRAEDSADRSGYSQRLLRAHAREVTSFVDGVGYDPKLVHTAQPDGLDGAVCKACGNAWPCEFRDQLDQIHAALGAT